MKVLLSDAAQADLEDIADFIAKDNPRRALTFVRDLRAAARHLAGTPEAFPLVLRYHQHGIRRRVLGSYLIFYRVEPGEVLVIRILHGARDYDPFLT